MKKKKSKSVKTVSAPREKQYLASLNLTDWWEDFAHSVNKNGTQKYPTIWSFIKKKASHSWQRDFLYWILGPVAGKGDSRYPGYTQYDWEDKRQKGFWFSSKNIENLKSDIRRKATSFDRLQTAGDSLLEDLAELTELQRQISKEFGGRLFLADNTAEENAARASLYLRMKEQVQTMKAHILQTYAKTQGMDMNQLSNFLELFAQGMGNRVASQLGFGKELDEGAKEENTYRKVLNGITDMVLKKSADLDLALPSEAEKVVIEATSTKKARVQ